jgi:CubicO group peptidase (beta-lactamase class C family)
MPEADTVWIDRWRQHISPTLVRYQVPGWSLAVAEQGAEAYSEGFGLRDRELGLPVTPDTVFGIGSITKSFTCVAVMQLKERGLVSLDDPVVRHLPELERSGIGGIGEVRVHHLMSHTSGLPPLPYLSFALWRSTEHDEAAAQAVRRLTESGKKPIDSVDDLMDRMKDAGIALLGYPGTHFSYSNDGYALLGEIVARASGVPYAEWVEQHILGPAGMRTATFSPDALAGQGDVSTCYAVREEDGNEQVYPSPIWWDAPAMRACGFLKASARDMLRYAELYRTLGTVRGERILCPDSVREMMTPRIRCAANTAYGYGLMLTPRFGEVSLVEHGGAIKGVAAFMALVPERGLTAVGLSNLAGVPTQKMVLAALASRLNMALDTRRAIHADRLADAKALAACVGTYASAEGAHIEVTLEDGQLMVKVGDKRMAARAVKDPDGIDTDVFECQLKDNEIVLAFERPSGGPATAVQAGLRTIARQSAAEPEATAARSA